MKFLNNIDLGGTSRILNIPVASAQGDLVTKAFMEEAIDQSIAGFDFQRDVKAVQFDGTLVVAEPVAGQRFIITNIATMDSSFGTIAGLENGDIIEYNGTGFEVSYDVSIKGDGILVYSTDEDSYFKFVKNEWTFGGLTVINAGTALTNDEGTFSVKFNNVEVGLNGSGELSLLDDSVTKAKIASDVAGIGLLQDVDGSIAVKINDTRLSADAEGIKLVETYTKKVVVEIGDGALTTFSIAHNLGSRDVIVQIMDSATYSTVEADVTRPDANNVTFTFASVPSIKQYRAVIIG